MSEILKAPVNPIFIRRVKKGDSINRSLDFFSHATEAAPEDGIILREDRGQKIKGTSLYVRLSDLKKIKDIKLGEEIVVYPWENGR
jgi:hypothetical protein